MIRKRMTMIAVAADGSSAVMTQKNTGGLQHSILTHPSMTQKVYSVSVTPEMEISKTTVLAMETGRGHIQQLQKDGQSNIRHIVP